MTIALRNFGSGRQRHVRVLWMVAVLTTATAWSAPGYAARVAVIIANGDYGGPATDLHSPPLDFVAMNDVVKALGFERVLAKRDASRDDMIRILKEARIAAADGDVLFYFSGHGIQLDGQSFLLPARFHAKDTRDVAVDAVSVTQVLGLLGDARLRVIVLDACRNNAFGFGTKSSSGGLARDKLEGVSGTIISYSAAPGTVAYDGEPGQPSPYTSALVRYLREPGLDLPNVFMRVRGEVLRNTRHNSRGPQRSEEVTSLLSEHAAFTFFADARRSSPAPTALRSVSARAITPPADPDPASGSRSSSSTTPGADSIVLLGIVGVRDSDAPAAKRVEDALLAALTAARRPYERGPALLAAAVEACDAEPACVATAARDLAGRYVVVGSAGDVSGRTLVHATLLDVDSGVVIRAASASIPIGRGAARLTAAADSLVAELLGPVSVRPPTAADRSTGVADVHAMRDLRLAVAFDQAGAGKRLQGCLAPALVEREAQLVDGSAARAIFEAGRALRTGDVDVAIVGDLAISDVPGGKWAGGVNAVSAEAYIRIVRAETGEVIGAADIQELGNGFGRALAEQDALKRVCTRVIAAIDEAVRREAWRGRRVRVDVAADARGDVSATLLGELRRLQRVARVSLRSVDAEHAVFDVVTRAGGDGIALAVDLTDSSTTLVLIDVGPAVLRLRWLSSTSP